MLLFVLFRLNGPWSVALLRLKINIGPVQSLFALFWFRGLCIVEAITLQIFGGNLQETHKGLRSSS